MKRMLPIVFWLSLVGLGCESAVEAQTDARVVVADASATPDAQSNDLDAEVSPVPDVGSVIDSAIPDADIFDMATARDAQAEMDIDVIVDADTRDMNLPDQDSEEPDRGVADRFEDQVLAVLMGFGIEEFEFIFPFDEVSTQTALPGNEVAFIEALTLAIESFLEDDRDAESPRALLEFAAAPPCFDGGPAARVRCFMNEPGSMIRLVTMAGPPAENGESVEQNWVFFMTLPSLSDHLYWAIVDRSGVRDAYNYGFN